MSKRRQVVDLCYYCLFNIIGGALIVARTATRPHFLIYLSSPLNISSMYDCFSYASIMSVASLVILCMVYFYTDLQKEECERELTDDEQMRSFSIHREEDGRNSYGASMLNPERRLTAYGWRQLPGGILLAPSTVPRLR